MPGLRERKKAQTRAAIQRQALRLFAEKGYEATTVEEIAAAAGVSHMTFFRYFPSKEDVVLMDDYDPLLVSLISARPAGEPTIEKIRHACKEGLTRIYAADSATLLARTQLILHTPALRTGLWEHGGENERMLVHALAGRTGQDEDDLRMRVVVAACLAAINTAILVWADGNGARELPDLIDQALILLQEEFR